MKNIFKLSLLALFTFSLAACDNGENNNSSELSSSSEEYSWPDDEKITVLYYKDYLLIDEPYYVGLVIPGKAIDDIPADPTEPTDPYFDTFVGWSKRAIVDDLADLYDFSTIIPASQSNAIVLYGIWISSLDL